MSRPYSDACERNREPILVVLREAFAQCSRVLEIGSGTGQHAAYLAAHLPHLVWQPSDLPEQLPGIEAWRANALLPNLLAPMTLDIAARHWPDRQFDAVFSANTLHIVAWQLVQAMFDGIARCLLPGGALAVYGPFNYCGAYTSESNRRFDEWLKARDPASAIRDIEAVEALALEHGLVRQADQAMPANNRMLLWRMVR